MIHLRYSGACKWKQASVCTHPTRLLSGFSFVLLPSTPTYDAALIWQEQVEATIAETRKIVSGSEAVARQLRAEMEGRGGDLSERRRVAEEGLAVRPTRLDKIRVDKTAT